MASLASEKPYKLLKGKKTFDGGLVDTDVSGFRDLPSMKSETEFLERMIEIDEDMGEDDIQALKFLCRDVISYGNLEKCTTGLDIFKHLKTSGKIVLDNVDYLLECLGRIHRLDLIKKLGYDPSTVRKKLDGYMKLLPFRVLLFEVAEEITDKELKTIKFSLSGRVGSQKLRNVESSLQLMTVLEQEGELVPEKPEILAEMMRTIKRNDLMILVDNYRGKNTNRHPGAPLVPPVGREKQMLTSANPVFPQARGNNPYTPNNDRVLPARPIQQAENGGFVTSSHAVFGRSTSAGTLTVASSEENSVEALPITEIIVKDGILRDISSKVYERFEDLAVELNYNRDEIDAFIDQDPENAVDRTFKLLKNWRDNKMEDQGRVAQMLMITCAKLDFKSIAGDIYRYLQDYENSQNRGVPARGQGQNLGNNYSSLAEASVHNAERNQNAVPQNNPTGNVIGAFPQAQGPLQMPVGPVVNDLQNMHIDPAYMTQPGMEQQMPQVRMDPVQQIPGMVAQQQYSVGIQQQQFPGHFPPQQQFPRPNTVPLQAPPRENAVQPGERQMNNELPEYNMTKKPRGICVIINNKDFYVDRTDSEAREMPPRTGTEQDGASLKHMFTKLHFRVEHHMNLTDTEIMRLLVHVAHNIDHREYDCFVCCVLTHGLMGHLFGVNGRLVPIKDMTATFQANRCPTLAGKPKLFFLQACQGRDKMLGGQIEKDGDPTQMVEADGDKDFIPNEADFLLGYATVPGYVSFRSRNHGSWYIRKLVQMLETYADRHDLMSILVKVNEEVSSANANMDGQHFKQVPAPLVTLRKKLFFR